MPLIRNVGGRASEDAIRSLVISKRVFEKSRFCHISPTIFPIPASKQLGANPGPRTVSLDLPGLFKHALTEELARGRAAND